MQRIRLGRITAAVTALALAGAIQHADEIQAMTSPVDLSDGGIQILPADFRGIMGEKLPFSPGATLPDLGKLRCTTEPRLQRRICVSRHPNDSVFAAIATTHRATNGDSQLAFDAADTDTIVTHAALVRHNRGANGQAADFTWRSAQRWDGVSWGSTTMTLNGADTLFSVIGSSRSIGVSTYSDVRLARHPSFNTRNYPASGVLRMTWEESPATPAATQSPKSTIIVQFDGTRRPDAWLDGKRHRLDLDTGRAFPYIDE